MTQKHFRTQTNRLTLITNGTLFSTSFTIYSNSNVITEYINVNVLKWMESHPVLILKLPLMA